MQCNERGAVACKPCTAEVRMIELQSLDITPTRKLHQYWCFNEAEDQSPPDGNHAVITSPHSSNKGGSTTDSYFSLNGAHQCDALVFDAG